MDEGHIAPGGVVRSSPDSAPALPHDKRAHSHPVVSTGTARAPSDSSLPTLAGAPWGEGGDGGDEVGIHIPIDTTARAVALGLLLMAFATGCASNPQPYRPDPEIGWQNVAVVGLVVITMLGFAVIDAWFDRRRK